MTKAEFAQATASEILTASVHTPPVDEHGRPIRDEDTLVARAVSMARKLSAALDAPELTAAEIDRLRNAGREPEAAPAPAPLPAAKEAKK